MKRSLFIIPVLFLSMVLTVYGQQQISVVDFGAKPDSKQDATAALIKALEECKKHDTAILVFPKGRYDFYAPADGKRIFGLNIDQQKNLTIDGQGSEWIFHGIIGVANIHRSENVALKNFSVDWEKPFIVQGNIVDSQDNWVDIRFDTKEYPFEINDGKIQFIGEGWKRNVQGYTLLFDAKTKELVYKTRDNAIGNSEFFNNKSEDLGNGVVRFHGKPNYKAEPGTYIALWLGRYIQVAIDIKHSKDILLENIDIYHSLSHGVVAFKTENLTLRKVDYKLNEKKDRVFSLVADGYHLNTCKGKVLIEHCTQVGMGDDFLNLHGMNVMVKRRVDDHTVEVGVQGRGAAAYVLGVGDEVWFINGDDVQRTQTGRIKELKEIHENGKHVARHIIFEQPVPQELKEKDALENKTWNAELLVRHCRILKQHRARGLLITTPCKAVVENNYFRTAGTAILIEGDVNFWYESGGCTDLLIRNNQFEDCFSSGYNGDWGHAVITIHPSFKPKSETDPAYHRNIRIEKNVFKYFDYPILFARSVDRLVFEKNKLEKTTTYEPFASHRESFHLDGCRNVLIQNNQWADDVLGKNIKTAHMKPDDLSVKDSQLKINSTTP